MKAVVAVLLAGLCRPVVADELPAITVFETDSARALIPAHFTGRVTRYDLDTLAAVEDRLNASLPADPEKAGAEVKALAKTAQSELQTGWAGLMAMALWRIEYVPAIVFGKGEAVWYGPHLDQAIEAWRKTGGRKQ